jgi:rod shape-determining protein MreD
MSIFRLRRRRTKASNPQAARIPRGLSFRRRRGRSARPAAQSVARISFRHRRGERSAARRDPRGIPRLTLRRRAQPSAARLAAGRWLSGPRGLVLRLVALALATCILQLLVVSQITVLGVSADLTPLVVASAGVLCGSLSGAVFGFAVGLLIDLAFVQVIGISSLLLTLVGYGAGRLGEYHAPQAPLTRLLLGAAATAVAVTGYGAIEFMLGVNTPVSYELAGAIVKTTLLNSLIALPVYALTRRALRGALPARGHPVPRAVPNPSGISPLMR